MIKLRLPPLITAPTDRSTDVTWNLIVAIHFTYYITHNKANKIWMSKQFELSTQFIK